MKEYSASVKREDGSIALIRNQEYKTKSDFIHDLRRNGYKVNPTKVLESKYFDYIVNHTNCNSWDWEDAKIKYREYILNN